MYSINTEDILKTYNLLAHKKQTEIRVINGGAKSVFVSNSDEFLSLCELYNKQQYQVYVGINERSLNGTKEQDVISEDLFCIDIDPVRDRGTAATVPELQNAKDVADEIQQYLISLKVTELSVGMSGNGIQIWIRLPSRNLTSEHDRNKAKAQRSIFMHSLQDQFNTPDVKVDSVFDLPRIMKVMGCYSWKHKNTPELLRTSHWIEYSNVNSTAMRDLLDKQIIPVKVTSKVVVKTKPINGDRSAQEFNAVMSLLESGIKQFDQINETMISEGHQKWIERTHDNYRVNMFTSCLKKFVRNSELSVSTKSTAAQRKVDRETALDKIRDFKDNAIYFNDLNPFFFLGKKDYMIWNSDKFKYVMIKEHELLNAFEECLDLHGQTYNAGIRSTVINSFKDVGCRPPNAPKEWIQFKGKYFDIVTKEFHNVTPEYFFINPLPWFPDPEQSTTRIDQLFKEWMGSKKDILYEIASYLCFAAYPIHSIFAFMGIGRNGKSQYLNLLNKFVGEENTCTSSISAITNDKFEIYNLKNKLVCFMGETSFQNMRATDKLKQLCGQDKVSFRPLFRQAEHGFNYAKIIIASNGLPMTPDESDGFYRRWNITEWNNKFPQGQDILETIPDEEFNGFAWKVCQILPELIKKGKFSNDVSIELKKQHYKMNSNCLEYFIAEVCTQGLTEKIPVTTFYMIYKAYLKANGKRDINRQEFTTQLHMAGIEKTKVYDQAAQYATWHIIGYDVLNNWERILQTR